MGGQRRPPLQRVRVGNTHSDLHQFLFLLGAHLVDLLDVLVGEILNVLFGLLLVVLGQFALLLGLLDVVDCVAADVADGDLGILGVFADLLREILAALLGQLREDEADNAAVILRVDAEIRGLDGLFNCLEQRPVPRLDDERAGVGGRDGADLVDGARLAVIPTVMRSSTCALARPARTAAKSDARTSSVFSILRWNSLRSAML